MERTFAWLNPHRRLSKDHEQQEVTSETLVRIVMIRPMLRRLARS
jgi:putative transposase